MRAVHLDQKGRGRALRRVWSGSDAEVVTYMDVATVGETTLYDLTGQASA